MDEIIVAHCGIVCSACGAFTKGKCLGCLGPKPMFKNCPVKKCAKENSYATCADCGYFADLKKCSKLNNLISKIMGFIFRTDRIANLGKIRQIGLEDFKREKAG